MHIKIIYEDSCLIIIDKPSGLIVNNSKTTINQNTIQDWAQSKLNFKNVEFDSESHSDFYKRGGIVHRLDKETSGILIIAKNQKAFQRIQTQFKERNVKKTYLSFAHGRIHPLENEINAPVGRLPWNRKQFGIIPGGRESKTAYKILKYYQSVETNEIFSYIELYPLSGRTHQIRVHLKYIGHPVYSDYLYAGRKTSRKDRQKLVRVFLHASKISFNHPYTNNVISFESPLPEELRIFLKKFIKID